MSLARNVLLRMSHSRWLADQMARHAFTRRAVRRFMPGEEVTDALAAAQTLGQSGLGTVLTQLGENLTTLDEADRVREHYLGVFDQIRGKGSSIHVSVKPTQLGLDLSPDACAAHLQVLATKAATTGSFLWLDMEDSSYVDRTLDLFRRLRRDQPKVGLCLQSYLHRTPTDLETLLPLAPAIRLVKGAYAEPPQVAFPAKRDTDRAYYELGSRLLAAAAGGGAYPVFGSHDLPLVGRMIARARELGVKDGAYEIHMLYGIRSAEQQALAAEGRVVRTLISYGRSWFPWYMRRLAERPANVWFVLRSLAS
jgi:proline dehydrogenase